MIITRRRRWREFFKCQTVTRSQIILNSLHETQRKAFFFLLPFQLLFSLNDIIFLSIHIQVSTPSSSSSPYFPFLILVCPHLLLQIVSRTHPSLPSHAHQRCSVITQCSWRPLRISVCTWVTLCVCVRVCVCSAVSHYAFRDIIKRGNIAPLKSFSSLSLTLSLSPLAGFKIGLSALPLLR